MCCGRGNPGGLGEARRAEVVVAAEGAAVVGALNAAHIAVVAQALVRAQGVAIRARRRIPQTSRTIQLAFKYWPHRFVYMFFV